MGLLLLSFAQPLSGLIGDSLIGADVATDVPSCSLAGATLARLGLPA
jgi:hypothetical protein